MSEGLLDSGYVGPAAVIAGSVLEEHLRKLAAKLALTLKNDRGRDISAETLGVDLRKAGAITEVQRKRVVAWYAIRNEAAHNVEHSIDRVDVERMIDGVRGFVARHPA
ncbi:MAG: hypothetical protein QOG70_428 [Solirubrobacteraceae bacterium]|jgi:propanediol dehydratase small subunit|nr:hypothetical protein [Solirubrobacteraceae bacterium]